MAKHSKVKSSTNRRFCQEIPGLFRSFPGNSCKRADADFPPPERLLPPVRIADGQPPVIRDRNGTRGTGRDPLPTDLDLPAERGRPPPVFIQVRTGGEILRKEKQMAQDGGSKLVAGGTWAPASEEGTGNPVQLGGEGGIGEVKPHPDDHCFDCAALKRGDPLGEDAADLFFCRAAGR